MRQSIILLSQSDDNRDCFIQEKVAKSCVFVKPHVPIFLKIFYQENKIEIEIKKV